MTFMTHLPRNWTLPVLDDHPSTEELHHRRPRAVDLPAGWSAAGSAARGPLEEFVLTGDLDAGGVTFGKWGYAYRPEGEPAGTYSTTSGATLLAWWNGANEL